LKAEHHDEGHPDNPQRGALYRFSLDNYDEENEPRKLAEGLTVRVKLPVGVDVEERYFYLEGYKSGDDSYRECAKPLPHGREYITVRCDVPQVKEHVTMYIHVNFPKKKFTTAELADLERAGSKVTASLARGKELLNEVSLPLLHHWREEL